MQNVALVHILNVLMAHYVHLTAAMDPAIFLAATVTAAAGSAAGPCSTVPRNLVTSRETFLLSLIPIWTGK